MKKSRLWQLGIGLLILVIILSCTIGVSAAPKKLKVFFVPKFTGFIFFELARDGAEKACKDLGAELTYVGTTTADVEGQVQVLRNLVAQKPDCIVTALLDRNASVPTLKMMRQRGTTVVTFDDDAAAEGRDVFVNMAPFEVQGQAQLESALYNAPEGGKVIWLAPSPTSSAFIGQKKGIDWNIEHNPRYQGFKFIDTLYMDDDPDKSYSVALSAMQAHPDLRGFITGSGIANPAVNKAIQDSGKTGKVFCTGHALPSTMKTFLDNGVCKQYALWSPYWFGYMATYLAIQMEKGKVKGRDGVKFKIPNVGTRSFESSPNGLVTNLNMMMFFRKDHDDFNTGLLMNDVLKTLKVPLAK